MEKAITKVAFEQAEKKMNALLKQAAEKGGLAQLSHKEQAALDDVQR